MSFHKISYTSLKEARSIATAFASKPFVDKETIKSSSYLTAQQTDQQATLVFIL
ncbi:hypothetical protein SeseC_01037 [Streptococcus equi subsp. zooepidemicus ATCC 35246]|nr:hypothetical protein SeseC_01037 [Streptococcus equi subsp. zooepidemicus ATCC 35246]